MSVPALPHDAPSVDALRSAVDAMDALVTLLCPEGRILHENRAWKLAVATGQIPAVDPAAARTDRSGPDVDPTIAAGVRDVLEGRRELFEAEHRHGPPGAERWLALRASPIAVDGVGALVVHTDVTARHLAERASTTAETRDHATGLVTRRQLERRLADLLTDGPVGVVAVHVVAPAVDDEALRETTALLLRLLDPEAVAGRYDADVFVVLLPATDAAGLRSTAVALEAGWRARLAHRADLTVAVGSWPAAPGGDAHHVLARAVSRVRPGEQAPDGPPTPDELSPLRCPAPSPVPRSAPRSADGAAPRSRAAPRPPAPA